MNKKLWVCNKNTKFFNKQELTVILNFYIYTLLPYDMMKIHIISHDKTITYVLFCAADPLEGMIGSCRLKKKIQELKQAKSCHSSQQILPENGNRQNMSGRTQVE